MSHAILCIDTISSAAGVAVVNGDEIFYESLDPKKASESIIQSIDQLMHEASMTLSDLTGVMVILGPGSFTGLRVGISVANQFAHQLELPIRGVRMDEWWFQRSDASDLLYVQSMNKAEVFVVESSQSQILQIELLVDFGERQWLGELKFDHSERMPDAFECVQALKSIEMTWQSVVKYYADDLILNEKYEVVLPFYGKAPNITPAKKSFDIADLN